MLEGQVTRLEEQKLDSDSKVILLVDVLTELFTRNHYYHFGMK